MHGVHCGLMEQIFAVEAGPWKGFQMVTLLYLVVVRCVGCDMVGHWVVAVGAGMRHDGVKSGADLPGGESIGTELRIGDLHYSIETGRSE
jgi:hypothetical protein